MLLAQVCSLHDPTPRTFVVHVLALFERGILDGGSIRFLWELGLVPEGEWSGTGASNTNTMEEGDDASDSTQNVVNVKEEEDVLTNYFSNRHALAIVPYHPQSMSMHPWLDSLPSHSSSQRRRSNSPMSVQESRSRQREATAIRRQLERQESFSEGRRGSYHSRNDNSSSSTSYPQSTQEPSYTTLTSTQPPTTWSVEHHPLTLSRYQRDFHQLALLARGAFGSVYHSIHKLEKKSYAVKCVTFENAGYWNGVLAGVVREVRCLAALDCVNCVRYYTSWLGE